MRQSPWISTTTAASLRASAAPGERRERLVRALREDRVGAARAAARARSGAGASRRSAARRAPRPACRAAARTSRRRAAAPRGAAASTRRSSRSRARRTSARARRRAAAGSACDPTMRTRGFIAPLPRSPPRSARGYAARRAPRPTAPAPAASASRSAVVAEDALDRRRRSPRRRRRGTSRPFSPSRTTSGTPPTAVAITGVPTASASSTRVREVLPRRREQRRVGGAEELDTSSRVPGAEEAHAVAEAELAAARARALRARGRRRARAATRRRTRASGRERVAERLLRRQPARRTRARARRCRAPRAPPRAAAARAAAAPGSGRPIDPLRVEAPAERDLAQVGARRRRTCAARRRAAVRVARSARTRRASARRAWNSSSVPANRPDAALALERLVGDELDDERPPRDARAERGAAHHRRRVDDVGAPRARARRAARRPRGGARRGGSERRTQRTGYGSGAGSASARRHDLDLVARARGGAPPARARGSPGPPTSGGQMPETTRTFTARRGRRREPPAARELRAQPHEQRRPTRRRRRSVETSIATAAPVTPHSRAEHDDERQQDERPRAPCVTIRSRGRPIVTGNDFVQPSTSWIAAATSTIRAASTRRQVLAAEDDAHEPRHRDQEDRHGDDHRDARRRERCSGARPRSTRVLAAALPVARLLGEQHEPHRGARGREAALRRLRDAEVADLRRAGDDAEEQRASARARSEMTPVATLDCATKDDDSRRSVAERRSAPAGSGGTRASPTAPRPRVATSLADDDRRRRACVTPN